MKFKCIVFVQLLMLATISCDKCEKCPTSSTCISKRVFPECTYTEETFDYNTFTSECAKGCPKNSTGYFPSCACYDQLAGFNLRKFECLKCPDDSEEGSIYPNCNCDKVGRYDYDDNKCIKCPEGTTGVFPHCTCNDMSFFDGKTCTKECPDGSTGSYGSCTCDETEIYVKETNKCYACPDESTGMYPLCMCKEPLHYSKEGNLCNECPEDTTGIFPYCKCSLPHLSYYASVNKCLDYSGCIAETNDGHSCKYLNIKRECPSSAIGIGPDCLCIEKDFVFWESNWECFPDGDRFSFTDYSDATISPAVLAALVG